MSNKFPGVHVSFEEYSCRCCQSLPPDFYTDDGISIEYAMLFSAFENLRSLSGIKLPISRGYSCPKHNLEIYRTNIAAGRSEATPYSVHLFGLALDIVPPKNEVMRIAQLARHVSPQLRIGWKLYLANKNPHVHVDLGYLIVPRWSASLAGGVEW